ncbi:MAG: nucleotidyltransferase family protein [Desulfobacterales bacterium]|nr:nucleotidyltransferase family protein [Desulfobacterales bacterium]
MKNYNEIFLMVLNKVSQYNKCFTIKDNILYSTDNKQTLLILNHLDINFITLKCCKIDDNDLKEHFIKNEFLKFAYQTKLMSTLKRTFTLLAKSGIESILLKGFAMNRYYPENCTRPISDIDILVKPVDKIKSINLLINEGYRIVHPEKLEQHLESYGEVNLLAPDEDISVEIHWDFIHTKSYRKSINYNSEIVFNEKIPITLEGFEVNTLQPELDLAFLISHHILHHQFKRPLWLVDILLVISSSPLNLTKFIEFAKNFNLEKPIYYYLNAISNLFPEFLTEDILYLKKMLLPKSYRYHFYSKFTPPHRIFIIGNKIIKFKEKLFRNAFK